MDSQAPSLQEYRRIVIKIGSSLLVDKTRGLRTEWLESLCEDLAGLHAQKKEILIVSSGAIALGRSLLKMRAGALRLEENQACAAIGQVELAKAYGAVLKKFHIQTAQILLTLSDTEQRKRYLNARATIDTLLQLHVIPVINENDTVATSEIRYGDNDRLAARVATMVNADLLILLSDIDGLYSGAPHLLKDAKFFPFIEAITPEIEAMAGCAFSELSRGGMKTKLEAGKIATHAGTAMIIASGKKSHPLSAIDRGERHSFFAASKKSVRAWKRWISGHLEAAGKITIDDGAVKALREGNSLLAAGVIAVEGIFQCGDTVAIFDKKGQEIGRGLIAYDDKEAKRIAGKKSQDIAALLGYEPHSALVHRNHMSLHPDIN